ncbi:MAG: SIS domain-containing protein [Streptosporangiaceae bacterium]
MSGDDLDGWEAEFVLAADRLDTPDVIEAADPSDMLRQVASAAAQVRTALRSCRETDLSGLAPEVRPRAIVVVGMGSSGVAGDILGAVSGSGTPVQILTVQTERLPGWVGATDVVLAVSCSGTSTETLAIATEAARRGCRLAGVGAEGSALHRIAEQARAPFVPVVDAGLPRSMLWALTVPLLVMAERLGVVRIDPDVYELSASRLEDVSHQCRPASESFVNPGKSLALDLAGSLPVIWGTSALSGVAARRFAGQLNENAKYPAISGVLPSAAHNQVAMFDGPFAPGAGATAAGPEQGQNGPPDLATWDPEYDETGEDETNGPTSLRLVVIADPDEDRLVGAQRAAVTELAGLRGIGVSELSMDGEHPLVRLAGVVQLADYASVYLAIASGIDPGQAAAITDLKARIE